jgi:hypothetical protein
VTLAELESLISKAKKRRIKDADISIISLVPRGANQLPVLFKAEDGDGLSIQTLIKGDRVEEEGVLLSVVYAPEMRDSHGDIASKDVIKKMAYKFAKAGLGAIDIRHDGKVLSKEAAWVAESFIVQKDDSRFVGMKDYSGNEVPSLEGAWAVAIQIEDPSLRKLYKEGGWNGVSMYGTGVMELEDGVEKADRGRLQSLLEKLASYLGLSRVYAHQHLSISGDIDMDKNELGTLLKENNAELLKGIGTTIGEAIKLALTPAAPSPIVKQDPPPAEVKAPIFKGDINDPKAVRHFEYQTERYRIEKAMNPADPQSVASAAAEIANLNKDFEDIADLIKSGASAGRRRAAPSNAPAVEQPLTPEALSKEDANCDALAAKMAAASNASRGFAVKS